MSVFQENILDPSQLHYTELFITSFCSFINPVMVLSKETRFPMHAGINDGETH